MIGGSSLPRKGRIAWAVLSLVALVLWASTGHAEVDADTGSSGGGLLLVAALAAMVVLGSPLFMIIGAIAALCFWVYAGTDPSACTTLGTDTICGYDNLPAKMSELSTKNALLAIPFFVVSGAIMSAGDIANRLIRFARALFGFLPGGLSVATVGGCVFFAAISGSSPVTVIAIGTMMYPALVKAGYGERFSVGLVSTAGSLGILIPPSIPMLVFAIVAGGSTPIDVGELFLAGILPGLFIGGLLSLYGMLTVGRRTQDRTRFSLREVWETLREGFWAVMLPVLILGGIYSGLFTPTEAAAVSVVYALVVELFVHRKIGWGHLPKVLSESAVMMGTVLIIMVLSLALNDFLVEEKIPDAAVEWIQSMDLGLVEFLLIMNVLLLITGAFMDSISAIMVIAPLLTPIAGSMGIDPVHLAVIFIVNLEIGYLTPPIGLNLFVSSIAFKLPLGTVIRSVVPFIGIMAFGLGAVTYVPTISLGPVNVLLRDEPFYEPFPESPAPGQAVGAGRPGTPGGAAVESDETTKKALAKTTNTVQFLDVCDLAGEVMEDESIPADKKVQAWLDGFEGAFIDDAGVVDAAKQAAAAAGTPEAYEKIRKIASDALMSKWECKPLEAMLSGKSSAASASDEDADEDEDAKPAAADEETG